MMKLEVRLVFPGHGPTFSGLKQRIEDLLRHHEQRNKEIIRKLQDEVKTAYQIATEIPWLAERGEISFHYLPDLSQRLAIMETMAHLQFLLKQKEITRTEENGTFYYRA